MASRQVSVCGERMEIFRLGAEQLPTAPLVLNFTAWAAYRSIRSDYCSSAWLQEDDVKMGERIGSRHFGGLFHPPFRNAPRGSFIVMAGYLARHNGPRSDPC